MQTTLIAMVLLAAQPDPREIAPPSTAAPDAAAIILESDGEELELPPGGGHDWPVIIKKHNPNHTLGMVRYVERGGYLYARPYDYRTLLDYPWHHRKPLHPPCPLAVSMPYDLVPAPPGPAIEEVSPQAAGRRYPDVEVAPLDARKARSDAAREARLRRLIAPLGRPGDHVIR